MSAADSPLALRGIALIPRPTSIQVGSGTFLVDASATLDAATAGGRVTDLLHAVVGDPLGLPFPDSAAGSESAVSIVVTAGSADEDEAYRLEVTDDGIAVTADSELGAMHAVQTLGQLLAGAAREAGGGWRLPHLQLADTPRFRWRGGMLDVSRHFMPVEFVLRFIDLLAAYKFTVLHLHLTDDQGWRLEVPGYPRLTEIGAWRPHTPVGHARDQPADHEIHDHTPHGGYYSTTDIERIVSHAWARGVEVVPEIDMPGHMQAAIAAYPALGNLEPGNLEQPPPVRTQWGISDHVLNLEPPTMAFCRDVIDAVVATFPGRYLHLGGDECPTEEWRTSPPTARRLDELGLTPQTAQNWFLYEVARHAQDRGRRVIGWDEILDGGAIPAGTVVMSWRDEQGGLRAARSGHDVVMTPASHTYFDHHQGTDAATEPLSIGGPLDLRTVYHYEPIPAALEPEFHSRVLGSQFQIWTEYIATPEQVEYMMFPRALALSEVLWSGRGDDDDFLDRRVPIHLARLAATGVDGRPGR